ncbi:hypothetical protein K439DRAFT_1616144 [Ramaria rubella]|nr:hypothetical protein K439DRAFT_1616144 [Ramaria rubella]
MTLFSPFQLRLARYPALLAVLLTVYWDLATFPSLQIFCLQLEFKVYLFARAYAISSHNKLVFLVLSLLGTISVVMSIIAVPNNNSISFSNLFTFAGVRCFILFSKTEFIIHVSVVTLNGVFTILFDTALQSGIPRFQRNTLAKLLVQQGILSHI